MYSDNQMPPAVRLLVILMSHTHKHSTCLPVSMFQQFNGINYLTMLTASDMSFVCNMQSAEWQIMSLSDRLRKERDTQRCFLLEKDVCILHPKWLECICAAQVTQHFLFFSGQTLISAWLILKSSTFTEMWEKCGWGVTENFQIQTFTHCCTIKFRSVQQTV